VRTKQRGTRIWTGRRWLSEECRDTRRATREELPATKKLARQEKNLAGKKSVGPKFPQMPSENTKPLEITPFILAIFK